MIKIIPVSHNMENKIVYDWKYVQPNTKMKNGRWKVRMRGPKARARRRLKKLCPEHMAFKDFVRQESEPAR